jgi:hypothetical protein
MPELSKETEKKAKTWISAQRKKGKDDRDIRTEMLKNGYSADVISKLLKKRRGFWLIPLLIVIAVGIYFLIPFVSSFISNLSAQTCATQDCFILAANSCKSVKMQQIEEGSLFEYSARNCVLTKTLKKMNETEPVEMKDLLEGKSLQCSYTAGTFDEKWITTISIDIENCSGDLKDAIDELVLSI